MIALLIGRTILCTACNSQEIERLVEESLESSEIDSEKTENQSREEETVLRCKDGDTIDILHKGQKDTVRTLLIDTPEKFASDPKKKPMPVAEEATQFCKNYLEGNRVKLELSAKDSPYDSYGRLLAYVWKGEELYQERIVKQGLAIVKYIFPPDTKYLDSHLYPAQREAKKMNKGGWSRDKYVVNRDYNWDY